jgi:antitoxin VapB
MRTAKLFAYGQDQAVRLPREFRFEGSEVRIRRFGLGVILEPTTVDLDPWFDALDRVDEPFMPDGRSQPRTPVQDAPFELSALPSGIRSQLHPALASRQNATYIH